MPYNRRPSTFNPWNWVSTSSPPPNSVLHTPVTVPPPMLPGWNRALEKAERISAPFVQIPIDQKSGEYEEIQKLFEGTDIEMTSLERVVNPRLWRRFVRTRANLLVSKSDDIRLLAELGLSAEEIAHRTGEAPRHFDGSSFADNVMLLFHAISGGQEAFDEILSDGPAIKNGSFGRGIYFSDCPEKASEEGNTTGVLIIYAVMLGDCLGVKGNHFKGSNSSSTVRQVLKTQIQRRNPADRFFDSIVGHSRAGPNKYVIFNRALCCPLFSVYYTKKAKTWISWRNGTDTLVARAHLPSFAWTKSRPRFAGGTHHSRTPKSQSPFYAATIFKAIAMPRPSSTTQDDKIRAQLVKLAELGFTNMEVNERVLYLYQYDVDKAIEYLLNDERADIGDWWDLLEAAEINSTAAESQTARDSQKVDRAECDICMEEYPVTATAGVGHFVTLPCSPTHKMCTTCFNQLITTRTTMRGERQAFITFQCPFSSADLPLGRTFRLEFNET